MNIIVLLDVRLNKLNLIIIKSHVFKISFLFWNYLLLILGSFFFLCGYGMWLACLSVYFT